MKSRFDAALRVLSGALPAALAAGGAAFGSGKAGAGIFAAFGSGATDAAAHDAELVRTVGAGFTGVFRALDLLVASPAMLLPIGVRSSRAALASALVTAVCGFVAFDLARAIVAIVPAALVRRRTNVDVSPRLVSGVSAVVVLTALLSPAWQTEASAPGGAVVGALLVLLALRLTLVPPPPPGPAPSGSTEARSAAARELPLLAFVFGLAASYEPLVGLGVFVAAGPRVFALLAPLRSKTSLSAEKRLVAARSGLSLLLGLVPLGVGAASAWHAPELAIATPKLTFVEQGTPVSIPSFALAELGPLLLVVCVLGAVLSLVVPATRTKALPLVSVVLTGLFAIVLHAPAGPTRFAAPVLAGLAAAYVLGGATLGAVVVVVASTRVPFAEASAALVVVLELVMPVRAIDETTTGRETRAANATAIWNDVAWGDAPPASVVLVADRGTMRRIASARATGALRGDLLFVSAYDVLDRRSQRALIREPRLAPLYRDIALGIAPEELSLSTLGAERPVLATFDPRWDRVLSRHFVPVGLTSRFEAEPRGASERKRALEAFVAEKDLLVRFTVVKKEPELEAATATLLRARAIGMAATGERELLARALDDLRAFAPNDPVGALLVRRSLTTRGPIDVEDLASGH